MQQTKTAGNNPSWDLILRRWQQTTRIPQSPFSAGFLTPRYQDDFHSDT
jgi:hypothetical protein